MEEVINIKAKDGMLIDGVLYKQKNSEKLVIFLHGITANINQYLQKVGREFFYEKGYSVYAYNQYSDEVKDGKKVRALYEGITLTRQAEDLKDVYNFFKDKYKSIYIVGHSFGGLTTVIANLDCKKQSLWDPSYTGEIWNNDRYSIYKDLFLKTNRGISYVLNMDMKEDSKKYSLENMKKLSKIVKAPTQIIAAKNANGRYSKYYGKLIPNNVYEEMDADHCFRKIGQVREVCEKTYEWFEK